MCLYAHGMEVVARLQYLGASIALSLKWDVSNISDGLETHDERGADAKICNKRNEVC